MFSLVHLVALKCVLLYRLGPDISFILFRTGNFTELAIQQYLRFRTPKVELPRTRSVPHHRKEKSNVQV